MFNNQKHTDDYYLQLLLDGKEEALKIIFDQYYEGLCLYAESIIRNHQVAEEIVEDIFIYLWENNTKSTIQTSVKSYLYRSVHNNCLKYLNKQKTRKNLIEVMHYTLDDISLLHPLSDDYPISEMITKELEEKAGNILETLPDQCREIYKLNRFENLSYPEIATKLGITTGTVKTQMSRAFQRFRENLNEYLPIMIMLILFR
ncbi:MAG: RNA polymerase sigma-70 factor [Bacteroidales bacterium]